MASVRETFDGEQDAPRSARATGAGGRLRLLPEGSALFLRRRLIELLGFLVFATGLLLLAACLSFDPHDPSFNNATGGDVVNLLSLPGAYIADFLLQSLGLAALLLAVLPLAWGWRL